MARKLLADHPPGAKLDLEFAGIRVRFQTNRPELVAYLRTYFKPFTGKREHGEPAFEVVALEISPFNPGLPLIEKRPDPGKTKIKEEYADFPDGRLVRKRLTGMVFLFGGNINLGLGPCLENPNQVVNFINNRFMQYQLNRGWILGHAAAVRLGDRGMAFAGFSGAGKSSLALHVMNEGSDFVSNDRLLIRRNGDGLDMLGVAKLPRVNPGTLLNNPRLSDLLSPEDIESLDELDGEALWKLERKYDLFIDELYGEGKFSLHSPLQSLVILNWNRLEQGAFSFDEIDPGKRRDLLPAFIKSPGLFYEPEGVDTERAFSEEAYLEHLVRCQVYEVTGGVDFSRACSLCMEILKTNG
jgi:HprK-related kinase B